MFNSISLIREKLEILSSDSDVDSDNESVKTLPWNEQHKEETVCRICFGKREGNLCLVISCMHSFHISCVQDLLANGIRSCPLCRKNILVYVDASKLPDCFNISSDSNVESDNESVKTLPWNEHHEEEKEETVCRICLAMAVTSPSKLSTFQQAIQAKCMTTPSLNTPISFPAVTSTYARCDLFANMDTLPLPQYSDCSVCQLNFNFPLFATPCIECGLWFHNECVDGHNC